MYPTSPHRHNKKTPLHPAPCLYSRYQTMYHDREVQPLASACQCLRFRPTRKQRRIPVGHPVGIPDGHAPLTYSTCCRLYAALHMQCHSRSSRSPIRADFPHIRPVHIGCERKELLCEARHTGIGSTRRLLMSGRLRCLTRTSSLASILSRAAGTRSMLDPIRP